MKTIGIIGAGFSGTLTAIQLIKQATNQLQITLFDHSESSITGIAYRPYSSKHLLNVISSKMSAFPNQPDHFLNWVMRHPNYQKTDRSLIAQAFLPRALYGDYLIDCWNTAQLEAADKKISIEIVHEEVIDINRNGKHMLLQTKQNEFSFDHCVLATGNNLPRNPNIANPSFYYSSNYFQNPWSKDSVTNLKTDSPILIIGNGLTMVDTVLGLLENGFKGKMYSLSPNGFNILPHQHIGLQYDKLAEEILPDLSLYDLVKLVNKHIKEVRKFGVSPEPVIDSLRPFTPQLWKSFSTEEKNYFMSRLRHLWGVARHRIPLHSQEKIQQLRYDGRLKIVSGKLINMVETDDLISVTFYDKKTHEKNTLSVSRVINCTGPETDWSKLPDGLLKNGLQKGLWKQDHLHLGITTNIETYQVLNKDNEPQSNLYTLGSNLKGELWESTAVNELRQQAASVANQILKNVEDD